VNATGAATTIFLVDDDPAVLKALSRVLREEGWGVEGFASAEAFLARSERPAVGCLVLDVSMPGLDGLELQQRLTAAGESFPIVFVTGHGDIPMSVRAIKAGASDFLTKPVRARALVAAIHAAIDEYRAERGALADNEALRRRFASLTPREREVLVAVTAGRRSKEIAFDLGIVEQTVKFHRARIMERMHAGNVAELMHMAARLGIATPSSATDAAVPLDTRALKNLGDGAIAPATKPKASS
jgi:FixJ family two-component response regulator